MTDPYDSSPRTGPESGGVPETGARIDPATYTSGTGAGAVPAEPPAVDRPASGGAPSAGRSPAAGTPAPGFDQRGHVRGGRVSGVWIGLIATALFVILLIIFIAQNSRRVTIHFFGWHGQFSLALTILLAAVAGLLLVAIPGSVRIVQLRRALRKNVPSGSRVG